MSVQIDGSTGNIIAIKADYSGDVSIGGTLTYEDVTNIDAVGLITARNGIKVDDLGVQVGTGATIDGATNTLTFLTNGSERLRVTSAGLVGIGTDSPSSTLTLDNASGAELGFDYAGASHGTINVNSAAMYVRAGTGKLLILGANGTESARITSAGQMGLGTNDPNSYGGSVKLAVANTSGTCGLSIVSATNGDGNLYYADGTSGDAAYRGFIRYNHTTDQFRIGVAGAEKLRISSDGNVGIKNTVAATIDAVNSAGTLVVGDGSSAEGITIYTSDSTSGELAFADATSGSGTQRGRIIYAHGDNSMRISTNGSEVMRLDSSGRLLIGATSSEAFNGTPSALQIEGASDATTRISLYRTANDNGSSVLVFAKARNTAHAQLQNNDTIGKIEWYGADGNDTNQRAAIIAAEVDAAPTGNDMPGRIVFSTTPDGTATPVERMRITNSGKLLLGTTSATGGSSEGDFVVEFAGNSDNAIKTRDTDNTGTVNHMIFVSGSAAVGSISGTTGAASFNNLSDYRRKENDVEIADGIQKLKLLRPIRFNYISDPNTVCDGFFAHEVTPAVPTAVTGAKDAVDSEGEIDPQMLDTSKLVPLLTAALQEAITKIETLETKVAALEG